MLAVLPSATAGVILNDIGPMMELRGLMRIKSYVGKLPIARNFEEGAEILRWLFEAQFTKLAPQDWVAFAQRTWREGHGTLVPSHDPKLARALRGFSLERLPTLWGQFDALARIPLMVIRGANSDMLARPTLRRRNEGEKERNECRQLFSPLCRRSSSSYGSSAIGVDSACDCQGTYQSKGTCLTGLIRLMSLSRSTSSEVIFA
jgi:hypothetical protein